MLNADKAKVLRDALLERSVPLAKILGPDTLSSTFVKMDFSADNDALNTLSVGDCLALDNYVRQQLEIAKARFGVGGYAENRKWYQRSPLFDSPDGPRTVHLGIDIWATAGTTLYSPLAGRIHSLRDNANFGDYGPTIVLEHEIRGVKFFALFGHLSRESLVGKQVGQAIACGEILATVGNYPINGDWPPHLHYQLTFDMLGIEGDFPGVAAEKKRDYFLDLCPDPNLVLQIECLDSQNEDGEHCLKPLTPALPDRPANAPK